MNKQELIKKIAKDQGIAELATRIVINIADAQGWLRNPGEPIDPKDIRKGDRVRMEFADGSIYEHTMRTDGSGDLNDGTKYFLLDRPKPELPTEPGSVIRVRRDGVGPHYTLGKDNTWRYGSATLPADHFAGRDWEVIA